MKYVAIALALAVAGAGVYLIFSLRGHHQQEAAAPSMGQPAPAATAPASASAPARPQPAPIPIAPAPVTPPPKTPVPAKASEFGPAPANRVAPFKRGPMTETEQYALAESQLFAMERNIRVLEQSIEADKQAGKTDDAALKQARLDKLRPAAEALRKKLATQK
jgi:hypothetical protein